jgi:organic radical activating enzyme
MGCLNDKEFEHWFGNIHLSGPCNRSCYFCIGQHMMGLDPFINLNEWPLDGIDNFITECNAKQITEVYLTGSNTEPLLYGQLPKLVEYLRANIPALHLGVRSNGVLVEDLKEDWLLFDEASITICSTDKAINEKMMGGLPPRLDRIAEISGPKNMQLTLNITLGPENLDNVKQTLDDVLDIYPWKWINLREPYGQPHVGNPFDYWEPDGYIYGMPYYYVFSEWGKIRITYWNVHYVQVKSVNLYANGRLSTDYSVSKGHDPVLGEVKDQSKFPRGRQVKQWQYDKYKQLQRNSQQVRIFMEKIQ